MEMGREDRAGNLRLSDKCEGKGPLALEEFAKANLRLNCRRVLKRKINFARTLIRVICLPSVIDPEKNLDWNEGYKAAFVKMLNIVHTLLEK